MTRRSAWFCVVLPIAFGACEILGTDEDKERDTLDANRLRWSASGQTAEYVLRQQVSCFCGFPVTPHDVTVVGDSIADVRDSATGVVLAAGQWEFYRSVDGLFEMIEDALESNAHMVDVDYHPLLGYPALISIDYIRNAVDDEIYVTSELID